MYIVVIHRLLYAERYSLYSLFIAQQA